MNFFGIFKVIVLDSFLPWRKAYIFTEVKTHKNKELRKKKLGCELNAITRKHS